MSIGRPLSFDPQQALERVSEVFRERGFEAASLQDLMRATGLSKSSLYQQYGNKQALFDLCLSRYADAMDAALQDLLARTGGGRAFFIAVLDQLIDEPQALKGCLIFNTASEFGQGDPAVAARVQDTVCRIRDVFVRALKEGAADARESGAGSTQALANYLITAMAGLRIMAKAGMPAEDLKRNCEWILTSIPGSSAGQGTGTAEVKLAL